jgi:DNA-binding CsgD family transcriptional regulator
VATTIEWRRRADELVRRCHAGLDSVSLRREALQRLRGLVSIDAAFFATVDPATMLFTSAVSEEPLIDAGPVFLDNELQGHDVNHFVDLAAERLPARSLDQVTRGARMNSDRYRSIMRPLGLGDELRVLLRAGDTCWGVLCLHRGDGTAGFDAREVSTVTAMAPHLAEGLRRATILDGLASSSPPGDHGVIILDHDYGVRSTNEAAERWIAEVPAADWPRSAPMPLPVMAVAGALRSAHRPPTTSARLRTASGRWLTIHASLLHGDRDETVVLLEPTEPATVTSLILDAHGLTGAQGRVVALVLRGSSTQQIVNELHISAHTVQEHLKAVFDKTGVRSRRELAAALLHRG